MKLRDTTRKIISRLEEKSGYPVQVMEDKNLATFASLRIARGPLPAHILSFNAPPQVRLISSSAGNARVCLSIASSSPVPPNPFNSLKKNTRTKRRGGQVRI